MIVAFTGHRPERLPKDAPVRMRACFDWLKHTYGNALEVISGMADGWDRLAAETAVSLDVPFVAAVPWIGHGRHWPWYAELLKKAKHVNVVCDIQEWKPWVYQKRDEWMVDNSSFLISAWDGSRHGGTWNTIEYAIKRGKQGRIVHIYEAP